MCVISTLSCCESRCLAGEARVDYDSFIDGAGVGWIRDRIFRGGVPEVRRAGVAPHLVEHSLQLEAGGRRWSLPAIFGVLCQRRVQWGVVGPVSNGVARLRVHTAMVASILPREPDSGQVRGRGIDPA